MTNERTADVFVIGAADGVGRRLATLLTSCGDHVTGMHRKPEQVVVITITGATSAPGDLVADSVHELAAQVRGHDAVVFSAGAHGTGMDQTTLIDGNGLEKAAAAPHRPGYRPSCWSRPFPESEPGRFLSHRHEHYMQVKKSLAPSGVAWFVA